MCFALPASDYIQLLIYFLKLRGFLDLLIKDSCYRLHYREGKKVLQEPREQQQVVEKAAAIS